MAMMMFPLVLGEQKFTISSDCSVWMFRSTGHHKNGNIKCQPGYGREQPLAAGDYKVSALPYLNEPIMKKGIFTKYYKKYYCIKPTSETSKKNERVCEDFIISGKTLNKLRIKLISPAPQVSEDSSSSVSTNSSASFLARTEEKLEELEHPASANSESSQSSPAYIETPVSLEVDVLPAAVPPMPKTNFRPVSPKSDFSFIAPKDGEKKMAESSESMSAEPQDKTGPGFLLALKLIEAALCHVRPVPVPARKIKSILASPWKTNIPRKPVAPKIPVEEIFSRIKPSPVAPSSSSSDVLPDVSMFPFNSVAPKLDPAKLISIPKVDISLPKFEEKVSDSSSSSSSQYSESPRSKSPSDYSDPPSLDQDHDLPEQPEYSYTSFGSQECGKAIKDRQFPQSSWEFDEMMTELTDEEEKHSMTMDTVSVASPRARKGPKCLFVPEQEFDCPNCDDGYVGHKGLFKRFLTRSHKKCRVCFDPNSEFALKSLERGRVNTDNLCTKCNGRKETYSYWTKGYKPCKKCKVGGVSTGLQKY